MIRWTPIIWKDRDFDWEYMADIIEYKLRRMNKFFETYGNRMDSTKQAREMLIAAELLRRIKSDDNPKMTSEYCRMLGRLMGRKMLTWWD
jgi:hypothetical protein